MTLLLEFFFCSSNVAFDSFKSKDLLEWFEKPFSSAKNTIENVEKIKFEFISLVEDIILNEKDSEGRDYVIRLFHPSIVKQLVSRIVVLKVTANVKVPEEMKAGSDDSVAAAAAAASVQKEVEELLLNELSKEESFIQRDSVCKIFKYSKDGEMIRRFLKYYVFNNAEIYDDDDEISVIGIADEKKNCFCFYIEYKPEDTTSSSSLGLSFQKIRIPILFSEREYHACIKGLEEIEEDVIIFYEKTNIPLYFHIEKNMKYIFRKHPYSFIPFWFTKERENVLKQIRNESIEEYDFEKDILLGVLGGDFLLSSSFMLSFIENQNNNNISSSNISPLSDISNFSVRRERNCKSKTQQTCMKQKVKFVIDEIFGAFKIKVHHHSVYVNRVQVHCHFGDVYFSLFGGIKNAFKMVWNGLLPIVQIEIRISSNKKEILLKKNKDELFYSVALISFIKTFCSCCFTQPEQFKYLLEHVSVKIKDDDEGSFAFVNVPLWSYESIELFCEKIKIEFETIIMKNNYFIVSTTENPKYLFDPTQPSIYFKESEIKIYFTPPPASLSKEESLFSDFSKYLSENCSNDSDPVSLENFETDLTHAEKHEVVFMGSHGYKLETLERIIETETSFPLLPLTREPILESVGTLKQKISGVLQHRTNKGLLSYFVEQILGESRSISFNNFNRYVIKNLKVSIEARVDEDDYVHPIFSSSPNSIETLSYYCLTQDIFEEGEVADRRVFFSSTDEKGGARSDSPSSNGTSITTYEEEESNDSVQRSSFLVTVTGSYSSKYPSSEFIFGFTMPASPYVKTIDAVVKIREEINRKNETDEIFYSLWKRFHPFSSIPISSSIFPFVPSSVIKKSLAHHSKNERERNFLKGWAVHTYCLRKS